MPILVSETDFDLATEYQQLLKRSESTPGAVVQFIGLVRDFNENECVDSLHLDHYPEMTESVIGQICSEASDRWDIEEPTVIHRVGELKPADQIVLVAVASAHRKDAFVACEFVMDQLKTKAMFWKKEIRDGKANWIDGKESDQQRADRWQNN